MLQSAAVEAGERLGSPVFSGLRLVSTAFAALGIFDSIAGATVFTLTTGMPGHPSPYTVTVGSQITEVAFAVINTSEFASSVSNWVVQGSVPPGLTFGLAGNELTGPGTVTGSNPVLAGIPTTPATYSLQITAWQFNVGASLSTPQFTYDIIVTPQSPGAPRFVAQPFSGTLRSGQTLALNAVASGAQAYQWYLGGNPIAGATHPLLVLGNLQESGTFSCVATNASGSATSAPAVVNTVSSSNFGHLVNLSTRAQVGTNANILIAGFAVSGSGTQPILARVSGPAIASAPFDVPATLADPQLRLFRGQTALATDNGWAGNPTITAEAVAVGAFPWTAPASHDSAIATALAAGPYTAQVSGQSGDTGVALVELYDATASFTPSAPRLVNLSARVQVGTAANILIAGFVVGGDTSETVLIRASGPALSQFNVAGVLSDPRLQVFDSGSNVLATNAGWAGDAQTAAVAADVGAFAWTNPASSDSALVLTLAPGAYTAQVSGASGDTGVSLVEIYEVP